MSVNICVTLADVFCGNVLIKQELMIVLKDIKGDCINILIQKRVFSLFFAYLSAEDKFGIVIEHARA